MKRGALDPAEVAVIGHALRSVAVEMGVALRRTAFSPNIKERRDYSSAVFSAEGDLIAMGDDMPVHLGSMPMSVAAVLDAMRLESGDMAMLNDPYRGGTHLPDITMVAPVFVPRQAKPAFYVANRAHHADVGGMYPGSMGPCREIAQEGIPYSSREACARGKMDASFGDSAGECAHAARARRRPDGADGCVPDWVVRYARVGGAFRPRAAAAGRGAMIGGSERLMRGMLAGLPAGEWRGEDFLDDEACVRDRSGSVWRCATIPQSRRAVVDFTGTDRR